MNQNYTDQQIKKQIIEQGKKLYEKGYAPGMSGNISCRLNNRIFITATGSCLGDLSESKITVFDSEGKQILKQVQDDVSVQDNSSTAPKPSSESHMHIEIYKKRPDINSIIHAHCPYSTALGIFKDYKYLPILAEAELSLGKVPVVKYATPSTLELAKMVADNFHENNAVIMANHGATACGKTLTDAFYNLETLEFYSQVYLLSCAAGERAILTADNLNELAKLKHYKKC